MKMKMDTMKPPRVMMRNTLLMLNAALLSHAIILVDDGCVDSGASVPKSQLALARNLIAPLAADTEGAEFEHATFWEDHGPLLQAAWEEWEDQFAKMGFPSSSSSGDSDRDSHEFINPALSMALEDAFGNPSEETEATVKSLWATDSDDDKQQPALPKGVYSIQLLPESGISRIRNLLDAATSSGIPTRRPNGMNRHGVIVDSDVYGAVSMKSLVKLVEEELIGRVVRPIGRALFPDRVGCEDDLEYFAFTIRYDVGDDDEAKAGGEESSGNVEKLESDTSNHDFELKEHRDASIVTLNINLNLPEEGYAGSEVFFREFPSEETMAKDLSHDGRIDGATLRFSPGMAIIHLGAHRHGALPISGPTSKDCCGKRYNLVIWLFGREGDVRTSPYRKEEQMSVMDRWRGCNHTQDIPLPR